MVSACFCSLCKRIHSFDLFWGQEIKVLSQFLNFLLGFILFPETVLCFKCLCVCVRFEIFIAKLQSFRLHWCFMFVFSIWMLCLCSETSLGLLVLRLFILFFSHNLLLEMSTYLFNFHILLFRQLIFSF